MKMTEKPVVAIAGAGNLATFLACALRQNGFKVSEIIVREAFSSQRRARLLARKVGARVTTVELARFDADLIWFCVPDSAVRRAADAIAQRLKRQAKLGRRVPRFAFHSSGALGSRELERQRELGIAIASAHPLMTFVPGSEPSLKEVSFALEGDAAAVRVARRIVRDLGGESFVLGRSRKPAYHAWATMCSPLLLAYLVTLEEVARAAGLDKNAARRMSLPIIRQTLENYGRLGSKHSFSGPFIRGDAETVAKHLKLLRKKSGVESVYRALAEAALRNLPVKNRKKLRELLRNQG